MTALKMHLEEKNISVESVAESTGLSYSTVYQWIRGVTTPTEKNLKKLGKCIGLDRSHMIINFFPLLDTSSTRFKSWMSEDSYTATMVAENIDFDPFLVNLWSTDSAIPCEKAELALTEKYTLTFNDLDRIFTNYKKENGFPDNYYQEMGVKINKKNMETIRMLV